jgi:SAM-dependent methyltransferase
MLEVARLRAPHGVELKLAGAEALPFQDRSFERVVMRLLVHLVDRLTVFAEARRVLVPGGILAIATFDPVFFSTSWLNPFFPSIAAIDSVRFPTPEALSSELDASGFDARLVRLDQATRFGREEAFEKIRGKHIGTFDLIDEEEYEAGLGRAERELPERVDGTVRWVVAVARSRS